MELNDGFTFVHFHGFLFISLTEIEEDLVYKIIGNIERLQNFSKREPSTIDKKFKDFPRTL